MNRADLTGLRVFLAIAKSGTLRSASRELGVNPSAVSQHLKAFEEAIGVSLFIRNTRSVAFTDAGQNLFDRTHHLIAEVEAALEATRHAGGATTGQLRISLPFRAWQLAIAPRLAAFRELYPEIELDLSISEGLTDIVSNGFHAGIRLGDYLSDDMIAVALTSPQIGAYVASFDYLAQYGTPKEPADLLDHQCIRYRQISAGRIAPWVFDISGAETQLEVGGYLVFNDLRSIVDAAMAGFGIGWSLRAGVADQIDAGELTEVLSGYARPRPRFYLYFPKQLQDMSLLRAFIDHFSI
jgi:DNA-binding transcriptional LysR family regulator